MFPELRNQIAEWINDGTIRVKDRNILEIGSLNINGQVKDLFVGCGSYLGIDRVPGPGVDLVQDEGASSFLWGNIDHRFDTVIALETLEHDPDPNGTLEAIRFANPSQLIVSVPSFDSSKVMPYHDYGGDFWRISEQTMREVIMAGYKVTLARVHDALGFESIVAVGVK